MAHNDGNVHTRISAVQLGSGEDALPLSSPYVLAQSTLVVPLPRTPASATFKVRWKEGADEREAAVALPR